jgi:isorenieratene synthase
MKRRIFLRNVGLATLAGTAVGAAGLAAIQPQRTILPFAAADNDALPERPVVAKRVLVVGGGLAGIAAAYELLKRGFAVILVERASQLGGRLTGWEVQVEGETLAMEHGFHGFFNQYYNLKGLLAEAGLLKHLKPVRDYPILFKDKPMESFTNTTTLFPFNLLAVVGQAKSVSLLDFYPPSDALYELMRYQPERTFREFDGVDFKSFCQNINRPMVDTIIEPFAHTSFNQFHQYSTAEGIRFFHFFYLGNPDGMGYDQTIDDAMTSVVTPLKDILIALGGKVLTGMEAERLVETDGRITKLVLRSAGSSPGEAHQVPASAVGADWQPTRSSSGELYFVKRDDRGDYAALSSRCTHMGCPVALDPATGGFACPCHGAKYDRHGLPTAGPAILPLPAVAAELRGDTVHLTAAPLQPATEYAADYFVLACDVPGLKNILAHSEISDQALVSSVARLGVADPYIVWRIWLDRELRPQYVPFYTVSGYRYVDSIAIYSQLQPAYEDWARRRRGAVVELHAYAVEAHNLLPEAEIKRLMRAELDELIPELQGAGVIHDIYMMQENFPRWAPGDHAGRPGVATPFDNLFLAGDFVRLEVPANLMEAATMTGRMAANRVLAAEHLRENPIPAVALVGPLTTGT